MFDEFALGIEFLRGLSARTRTSRSRFGRGGARDARGRSIAPTIRASPVLARGAAGQARELNKELIAIGRRLERIQRAAWRR